MAVQCQYGTIGKILDYGVNPVNKTDKIDLCMSNTITDACKPNNFSSASGNIGEDRAELTFSKEYLWSKSNLTALPEACKNNDAQLFL